MGAKLVYLTVEEMKHIESLHRGDYLPGDIAPAIGFTEKTVIDIRGNAYYSFERKLCVTAKEYRAYNHFAAHIRTMENYYKLVKDKGQDCQHCGRRYIPIRKSSKFCSDDCRVASHRSKQHNLIEPEQNAYEAISILGRAMDNKETQYEAVKAIIGIKKFCDYYLPALSRWWRCDVCKTALMKFLPDEQDCQCGKDARWFIVGTANTSSNYEVNDRVIVEGRGAGTIRYIKNGKYGVFLDTSQSTHYYPLALLSPEVKHS